MAAFNSDKNMGLKGHAKPHKPRFSGAPKGSYLGKTSGACGASANVPKGGNAFEKRKA